ncbi:MAG: MBL fold metallo-hydrolase [Thermoguttaceae bacterium]
MKITWLGQGGYLIEQAGKRLAIDPYLSDALAVKQGLRRLVPPPISVVDLSPDAVFITHDHLDHFDPETLEPLLRQSPKCPLAGPQSVVEHGRKMGIAEQRLISARLGESMQLQGFMLKPTPAKHSDPAAIGLLVETEGQVIYISGDTLYEPTLASRVRSLAGPRIDAAFVCMNGLLGNMNLTEATELVAALEPAVAVPMHYGMFAENTADPHAFAAACRTKNQNTQILEIGSSVEL